MPKPLLIELREAGGHQSGGYEPLSIFAADLLIPWSSAARYEYRLLKVIVGSEVCGYNSTEVIVNC